MPIDMQTCTNVMQYPNYCHSGNFSRAFLKGIFNVHDLDVAFNNLYR